MAAIQLCLGKKYKSELVKNYIAVYEEKQNQSSAVDKYKQMQRVSYFTTWH